MVEQYGGCGQCSVHAYDDTGAKFKLFPSRTRHPDCHPFLKLNNHSLLLIFMPILLK
jgi:hypothetical protein